MQPFVDWDASHGIQNADLEDPFKNAVEICDDTENTDDASILNSTVRTPLSVGIERARRHKLRAFWLRVMIAAKHKA